ncbi:MAG: SAM-dependent methyltransferase [Zetaproteobacteria bacterium CG06_land_8_20_14_3_00_59_53]|nr:MAG: hypothetical protein AUK36_10575 [Zetaproteobacteria bacterium CG2_30_59_37]PIO90218.1 MAG: SAM-dependent methyltransferase [Zetaproteobacteria bacterium CG23_combo_of_CG06-09_8_20_14_all_59_86]PIQ64565.1 MAG: SAM-dependent methyltransferase [Zetaproteobacteria bacterium CG11_big_fil_rev_8_21_14_0_20_59_439]PIU71264.1 MAG: SAM-dependent methyltransferase [Zetaproteobacteria bacterium CG06_land_8_20_14_3_00_59_53]PIU97200.1 MAG: SAM-dependent methyltransferase [Zetaproteobacteria bacteri
MSEPAKYSTPSIHLAVLEAIEAGEPALAGEHLDIGSGDGRLIRLLNDKYTLTSHACDYTDTLMEIEGQKVDVVNLDHDALPYADNTFDLVTFTEVVEHVENHRAVLREIHRVLRPGGLVVVTTPNILNLKSRLRFLFFGFWNLFGPLHISASDKYSTGGHINPISYFYLCHSMHDAGLVPAYSGIDQVQRSSIPALILLWLPIALLSRKAISREQRKYKTVDKHNLPLVQEMNRIPMLLGRTIVVAACKPTGG